METPPPNCVANGRRQFVEGAENLPSECRFVLELLGQVSGQSTAAHERGLTADERLRLHQEHSRPVKNKLHAWLEAQLAERRTEPNSGFGQVIMCSPSIPESDDVFRKAGKDSLRPRRRELREMPEELYLD